MDMLADQRLFVVRPKEDKSGWTYLSRCHVTSSQVEEVASRAQRQTAVDDVRETKCMVVI